MNLKSNDDPADTGWENAGHDKLEICETARCLVISEFSCLLWMLILPEWKETGETVWLLSLTSDTVTLEHSKLLELSWMGRDISVWDSISFILPVPTSSHSAPVWFLDICRISCLSPKVPSASTMSCNRFYWDCPPPIVFPQLNSFLWNEFNRKT